MAKKSFSEKPPQSVAAPPQVPGVAVPQKVADLALTVPDMVQRVEHLRSSDHHQTEEQIRPPAQLPPVTASSAPLTAAKQATTKIGGMVANEIADRLKTIAFTSRISESVILETALRSFFGDRSDAEIGMMLRANGARRRRAFSK
jgi:hypothetical protein